MEFEFGKTKMFFMLDKKHIVTEDGMTRIRMSNFLPVTKVRLRVYFKEALKMVEEASELYDNLCKTGKKPNLHRVKDPVGELKQKREMLKRALEMLDESTSEYLVLHKFANDVMRCAFDSKKIFERLPLVLKSIGEYDIVYYTCNKGNFEEHRVTYPCYKSVLDDSEIVYINGIFPENATVNGSTDIKKFRHMFISEEYLKTL